MHLTYRQNEPNHSGALPYRGLAGAPACEIEITPEMIEAGVAVLYESGAIEHPLAADRDLVRDVFTTMVSQQRSDQQGLKEQR